VEEILKEKQELKTTSGEMTLKAQKAEEQVEQLSFKN